MQKFIFLILFSNNFITLYSQNKLNLSNAYELSNSYVGIEGNEIFKIYVKSKKTKGSLEIAKKSAVEAVLFSGIPGSGSSDPMVEKNKLNDEQINFLNIFLQMEYLQYVKSANDGTILPGDLVKIDSYFRIGYLVTVNKNKLRGILEQNNIIRKLGL